MERYGRASEGSQSDPSPEWTGHGGETRLEETTWQLGLGGGEAYPERPDEADCIYYLRTGFCGYGSRCRFNHPRDRGAVIGAARTGGGEYPEREGQPVCQYYMRTGACKFGASCKYHHPRQGSSSVNPVSLNYYGYPLRPGEKECSYYVKTGQCKFGATCKFHHPQPGIQVPAPSPGPPVAPVPMPVPSPSFYPTVQPPSVPPSQHYGMMVPRPHMLPGSYVQSPYGHVVISPAMVPFPSWPAYQASLSPVVPPTSQPNVTSAQLYGIAQISSSSPAYTGPNQSSPSVGPTSSTQKEHSFPERPGQPECQYYMRTGDCKFGSSCRYHHPPELIAPKMSVVLSPIGLPLRPGAPPCSHYAQRGVCKFGHACKFDHPMGTLSYSPSASSLADIPVAPYPVGSSIGTLAPSSSSSELRPDLISGSSKDSVSSRMSSSMSTSTGSVGLTFSMGGPISYSSVQPYTQSSSSSTTTSSTEAHSSS
ncbi:Zinc finger CCCH domain-containing protein [Quillaja saponaria]|uniref:Zinc finger CCCH domain-containing protein n=1 Tax=Quillaja saponaria TaxID=32244 RepID=A0AAD7QF68_QUISA|nr:Zinc finger CCCH domain-containing protein [Quillaja saponaria]